MASTSFTHSPLRPSFQAWIFALALFGTTLFLFTRGNTFPFFYHPDEPGKVRQVQSAEWNYHHPMLMLSTARAVALTTSDAAQFADSQRIVEQGRWLSAIFCAGAVTLLAMMVWIIAGSFAAVITGVLLMTNHQLFELAHYFKEDTALLFGIAAWFFAFTLFWKKPSSVTAAIVGLGAGLALSGKFLGGFTIALSLFLLPLGIARGRRLRALGFFALALVATYIVCNLPIFTNFESFQHGFNREVKMVVEGQRGTTRSVPHTVYLTAFQKNIFPLLWIPLLWYYLRCWKKRRSLTALDWTVALFPVVYLAILSFSPKTNDRYFLPATALFLCGVGMGANRLCRRWPQEPPTWLPTQTVQRLSGVWPRRLPLWSVAIIAMLFQLPELKEYRDAFRHDDLKDLTAWLNENLPDATLVIDRKVMLPSPRREQYAEYLPPVKATILKPHTEKYDNIEEMHRDGVTHVILSESSYGRYERSTLRPQKGAESTFRKNLRLYRSIRNGNIPLWARPRDTVIYLHPGLEVYALPIDED